jgi:hypothetical protein
LGFSFVENFDDTVVSLAIAGPPIIPAAIAAPAPVMI